MNTHLHITGWVLAIILLVVVISLRNKGNLKGAKITHMILRLVYLVTIVSGAELFFRGYIPVNSYLPEVILKSIAGLWIIFAMEMILVRGGKGLPTKGPWIQFVIMLLIVMILGFGRLPYGFLP